MTLPPDLLDRARRHWSRTSRLDQREPDDRPALRLLLGGRGSGKTFAGAGWINDLAEAGLRLALVGPSLHDVREVMIEGPSGVRALGRPDAPPRWEASRRRVVWDHTGATAQALSAEDVDSFRGPQFAAAWVDEFCAWRRPEAVLGNLRMGLRLGRRPQLLVTTTPRPIPALRALIAEPGACVERAPTAANADNLAPGFLEALTGLYGGTRLAAQELEGLVVEDAGAMFRAEDLARARGGRPASFETVVVAVDPATTRGGDACGIVVAGRREGRAYVLDDRTARGLTPVGWAGVVAKAVEDFGADRVVAEVNQGGEMVRAVLAHANCRARIEMVHAGRGKAARAAPVAALYEQGRVIHCGAFPALEEELMALGAVEGGPSPDRADALVWAVTHLLPPTSRQGPRVRAL